MSNFCEDQNMFYKILRSSMNYWDIFWFSASSYAIQNSFFLEEQL